jgi:hypothetical protein
MTFVVSVEEASQGNFLERPSYVRLIYKQALDGQCIVGWGLGFIIFRWFGCSP